MGRGGGAAVLVPDRHRYRRAGRREDGPWRRRAPVLDVAASAARRHASNRAAHPQIPDPMSLRVAFIGAGQMARNHVHAIARTRYPAAIVGIHDPLPDRADDFAALAGTRAFPLVQALLAGARPDVVHVCTPPAAHFSAA